MKANEVIRIGRNRIRAASTAASNRLAVEETMLARHLDDQDGVLGGERDQQHEADWV